ncbi:hypothetical protein, partial [Streptomyces sp. NPDC057582]|uniref:hypothetical protein n=1 Tax=Streptomyces sp. NPDC057582 TaxID=3346174 RepID=UPI00367566B6
TTATPRTPRPAPPATITIKSLPRPFGNLTEPAAELYVTGASDDDLAKAEAMPKSRRSKRSCTSWRSAATSRRTGRGRRGCTATTS